MFDEFGCEPGLRDVARYGARPAQEGFTACGLEWGERLPAALPPHCCQAVSEVASHCAKEWERLAGLLQQGERHLAN
ncbi:hypothetical protein ACIP8Z_00680 [Streptomyces sp. NPDC088553]|uniref:hypothetical protein n=1 Tax=Streptomyces sp. NPDC088553 TaxID=3365864 RepID=UPI0037F4F892